MRGRVGDLDPEAAGRMIAVAGDIAMLIDRDGVIRDMALPSASIAREGVEDWLDRRWSDTVAKDSRHKIDEMLRDAFVEGKVRWREVNQVTPASEMMALRFLAVGASAEGGVIAIGRDERPAAALQQKLLEAQQAVERDYSRLRDADYRYRLLFQTSGEAVLIVDAGTRKIVEANPAAERLIGIGRSAVVGDPVARVFSAESAAALASAISGLQTTAEPSAALTLATPAGSEFRAAASLFRQARATHCLIRLTPLDPAEAEDSGPDLEAILERMPDAFVIADSDLLIVAANAAFVDLAGLAAPSQAIGQPLGRFLGRAGFDLGLLVEHLRSHSTVRNFSTVVRTPLEDFEDVDVSAVSTPGLDERTYFGLTLRRAGATAALRAQASPDLRRSVEQLTALVGRVSLKEIVRETTELVERLCIEAALVLTKDNRASAAEVLGLSRQSLYSKLHRFGIANFGPDDE